MLEREVYYLMSRALADLIKDEAVWLVPHSGLACSYAVGTKEGDPRDVLDRQLDPAFLL